MSAQASVRVTTYFAPFDDTTAAYLQVVQGAQRDIRILIYGLHLPLLTDLLIAKHQAGVKINLILDHTQEAGRAEQQEVQKLFAAGIPCLVGTSPIHHQILHSKMTVIDEHLVESGSWNYSLSASDQSNTMTIVDDSEYARSHLEHWHRIWGFVKFHEAYMQPKDEATQAEDVPTTDLPANEPPIDETPTPAPAPRAKRLRKPRALKVSAAA